MSPSTGTTPRLVTWLRAAGETTRLRLLALCAERDLSVSDLALAVRQSEPRVSRHLKILSEAGLITRLRHGQWVHYQVVREGAAAGFVQGLITQLDRRDATFIRDRESLQSPGAVAQPAAETRLGRALRGFVEADGAQVGGGAALIVGGDHPEILSAFVGVANRLAVLAHSRRSAQAVRALAEREGLNCQVSICAAESLSTRDTERAGQPFDAIALDRLAAMPRDLGAELAVVRQAIAPGGRVWLFEKYESLESGRGRVVEHPIARLRRILSEAGLTCDRLSPIEADGEHVLAASAVLARNSNVRIA